MTIFANLANLQWQQVVMWAIGALLIYLAIKKEMEPALLLPMGFGAILVNLPMSGAVTQVYEGVAEAGALDILFGAGIANELFPLLLFIGIGAMIDFEPLLQNPKLMLFGAAGSSAFSSHSRWRRCSASTSATRRPSRSSARRTGRRASLWQTS